MNKIPQNFVLLLAFGVAAQAASICFLPNGEQSPDVPCDLKAPVSMCCGNVTACLSNGLCKDESTTNTTGNAYARGTCTDPTWQSPICPQQCILNQDTIHDSTAFDFRRNGVQVWECDAQGYAAPKAAYCCESAAEKTRCCSTKEALFTLLPASPGNALPVQLFNASVHTPSPPKTTPKAKPSTSSKPGATPAKNPAGAPTSISSHSAAATPTSPSRDDSALGPASGKLSAGAVIAIGVGASISGALLVSCVVVLFLRRFKPNFGTQSPGSPHALSDPDFGRPYGGGSWAPPFSNTSTLAKGVTFYNSGDGKPSEAVRQSPGVSSLHTAPSGPVFEKQTSPATSELDSRLWSGLTNMKTTRDTLKFYELE